MPATLDHIKVHNIITYNLFIMISTIYSKLFMYLELMMLLNRAGIVRGGGAQPLHHVPCTDSYCALQVSCLLEMVNRQWLSTA